ncbi:hypothetical protein H5410_021628, partial [Solanum commersonii]
IIGRHSTALSNCSVIHRLLLFIVDLILSFKAQHTRAKDENKTLLVICQMGSAVLKSSFIRSFSFLCSFLPNSQTQVQPFKKSVSNSATQDSIMNAHNKTQFTYAKIKCALKDSSYDSLISKTLMLTILASNASSSSTILFKCPHTKNDSIFTQWFNHLKF